MNIPPPPPINANSYGPDNVGALLLVAANIVYNHHIHCFFRPLMLITIRLTYVGFALHDGN